MRTCIHCGEEFTPTRPGHYQKVCTHACRQRAYRARSKSPRTVEFSLRDGEVERIAQQVALALPCPKPTLHSVVQALRARGSSLDEVQAFVRQSYGIRS